jgi:hypothetical protein
MAQALLMARHIGKSASKGQSRPAGRPKKKKKNKAINLKGGY